MGTSINAKQLSAKMTQAGQKVDRASRQAIDVAANETKRVTLGLMTQATGGDLVLSGMTRTTGPKRSARSTSSSKGKVGVRYKLEQRPSGAQAFVAATGPAHIIENDIAKHIVTSRYVKGAGYTKINAKGRTVKGRATRQSRIASVALGLGAAGGGRRAVLHWGGSNYARYTVASSKGRHPWERGMTAMRPRVPQIVAQANRRALIKEFG